MLACCWMLDVSAWLRLEPESVAGAAAALWTAAAVAAPASAPGATIVGAGVVGGTAASAD
ncbi:hypothetical protein PICSAR235_04092 [Mycobacterium avium subsp. paratuberculosis]|nr:hypothetical protein PICSAR235_04092 [Mycobacterium avium subsp. paratuberculosis]CAG7395733.1 hypothetical protein PICSAR7_04046 [Mycobacterium avium subsp. paratuberculosis]